MDFEESFPPLPSRTPDAYTEAVEAYCHGILRLHWNERLINKIFGRALQSHAAGRMVVQHFQWEREGAARPTLALLQRQAGSGGRTLATFFAMLRLAGMVTTQADAQDRRQRYLVPGPRLLDGLRTWVVQHLQCAEALGVLGAGHAVRLQDDAEYFAAFLCRADTILDRLAEHRGRFGGWDWFDQREGGGRVAMLLLREHCRSQASGGDGGGGGGGDSEAAAPRLFPLRAQELAERLGFSHSHVRNLVNEATAQGLLTQDARRGLVALTPRFEADLRQWLQHLLGWFAQAAQAADRDLGTAR